MKIKANEFDRRITILRWELTKDDELNEVGEWTEYYSCYAGVLTGGGSSAPEQGRTDYNSTVTFKLRYCQRAKAIRPEEYRVSFDGALYDIKSVEDVNAAHQLIKLRTVIVP